MVKAVTIVAMGDSRRAFLDGVLHPQGAAALDGEVWAINLMGAIIRADRIIMMDDLEDLRARSDWAPQAWAVLRRTAARLVTSRPHPDFPTSEAYPLEKVLEIGPAYLNNTVAYAIALAIAEGAERIALFGCDFGYPDRPQLREDGRACVEFWLGVAGSRGIELILPAGTTLMDSHKPGLLYGYRDQPGAQAPDQMQEAA